MQAKTIIMTSAALLTTHSIIYGCGRLAPGSKESYERSQAKSRDETISDLKEVAGYAIPASFLLAAFTWTMSPVPPRENLAIAALCVTHTAAWKMGSYHAAHAKYAEQTGNEMEEQWSVRDFT